MKKKLNLVLFFTTMIVPGLMSVINGACASGNNSAVLTVTVTITKEPCIINNDQMIDVDFGNEVVVTDVPLGLVRKPINYSLDCGESDPDKTLTLGVSGVGAGFNDTILSSSIPELGIEISANGTKLPLNSQFVLTGPTDKPDLEAILRQAPNSHLPTGEFTAGATLTVAYQ